MPISEKNTLTLCPSGDGGCVPDKDPWICDPGRVQIINNTEVTQELTNVTNGVLAPAPQKTVSVPTTGWIGAAGSNKGTYIYDDGLPVAGPRTGTIDPS